LQIEKAEDFVEPMQGFQDLILLEFTELASINVRVDLPGESEEGSDGLGCIEVVGQ